MTVDLDHLGDRAVAAAPTAVPPMEAVRRRVARRRQRRRAVAVALPLLLVVIGAGARLLGSDGDGDLTVAAGDGSAVVAGGLGTFVWPAPPRDLATVEELVDEFTTEVLDWPADEVDVEWQPARGADTELFGPQVITLVNTRLDRHLEITALELDDGWGIHHLGIPYRLDDPPLGTARVEVERRLVDGTIRTARLAPGDDVDLGALGPDDIVSSLDLYLDAGGQVIGASGDVNGAAATTPTSVSAEPVTPTSAGSGTIEAGTASQDAADARRDGVVPAVAALSTAVRVQPIPETFGTTAIEADEGTWVISSIDPEQVDGVINGCHVGDLTGTWGRDYVCLSQYADILLLDDAGTILRAYPFSEITPQQLALTDDAVYCARQGDGGVPDSMLCRIDRTTLDANVRIFPFEALDEGIVDQFSVPVDPAIDPPTQLTLWAELSAGDGELSVTGQSGSATVDPDTLELTEIDAAG